MKCEWNIVLFIVKRDDSRSRSVRFAEDVWYSCWSSAHCDRGEWNVSSCNWWVCTCASFSRNQCFSPAAQTQDNHASYWDQLLPSHHALCAIPQHLPAWIKQFVLIVMFVFLSFLWIESLSSCLIYYQRKYEVFKCEVQRVLFYNSKTVCTRVDVVCQKSIILVLFVYFVVYRLYSMVYSSVVN